MPAELEAVPRVPASDTKAGKAFESFLRAKGWPYVAVDEAKKAIFAGSNIESFDYLVYSQTGPNLMVLLTTPDEATPDELDTMREWGKTFGVDFVPVLVWAEAPEGYRAADVLAVGVGQATGLDERIGSTTP